MDFRLSEEQQEVHDLAERIFAERSTVERVKAVEQSDERVDRELWATLAAANLVGIALPVDNGGAGLGLMELCLVLEAQGRHVAPVPLWATVCLAALAIAEFGTPEQRARWLPGVIAGETVLSGALAEPGANDPLRPSVRAEPAAGGAWRLAGHKPSVPAAHVAERVLVSAQAAEGILVALVDPGARGVTIDPAVTTNREIHGQLSLDGALVDATDVLADPGKGDAIVRWTLERALVGLCALQVGVCEAAIRQAASYSSQRVQFGRPLSTFQGVALKAADAYIDTEAIRATMWQAAWRLSECMDASAEVEVAKWWACEGGHRVVHVTQHLHGGIGADVDYPVHRYFLWGRQIELLLGSANLHLARLGELLAARTRAGIDSDALQ